MRTRLNWLALGPMTGFYNHGDKLCIEAGDFLASRVIYFPSKDFVT
jgi:hypothetical protein